MSALPSAPSPVRPETPPGRALPSGRPPAGQSLAIRLATFAALATFGAAHWGALVSDPPTGRMMLAVAAATGGGAALDLLRRAALGAALRACLAALTALLATALALLAVGLPGRLLLPAGRAELVDGLQRGFSGLRTVDWPYSGGDDWVRLVILLGAPLLLGLGSAAAFWPARRGAPILRALGLVALIGLYGVAVTERDPGAPLLRGFLLLVLVAAWLWLPRLRPHEAAPGVALVVAVGVSALPVAAKLDADRPWWDWRSWDWFAGGKVVTFDWEHRYGPLDWPRDGTTVLSIKSDRALYWKTETLDRFDGFRWLRSPESSRTRTGSELPTRRTPRGSPWRYGQLNPRWDRRFRVTVRSLRSDFVVGAGNTEGVRGAGAVVESADGTMAKLDQPLERGDSYTVRAYVPDPSARQLRNAPARYPSDLTQYTAIYLPRPGESAAQDIHGAADRPATAPAIVPPRGDPSSGNPDAARRLLASPYAGTYRLALRIASGAPTAYEALARLERYLQRHYRYGENPPSRPLPLPAFLFKDRFGYCQQFSGAMALMSRMLGIPSRVATGFSPGSFNRSIGEYRVRDLDAHSWVEAYFNGIGWVLFDPTPPAAPAASQLSGRDASGGAAPDGGEVRSAPNGGGASEPASGGRASGSSSGGSTLGLWALPVGVLLLAAAGAGWLLVRERLASGLSPQAAADAQVRELRSALVRLGWRLPAGTTLVALERRLGRAAGPAAARYAATLRTYRYAARGEGRPGPAERRALRRELAAVGGLRARVRALRALPPGGPERRRFRRL